MNYELSVLSHEHEQVCATRLLECLTDMGNQQTNAVLLTLNGSQSIKPYQRYPAQPYYFADEHWRAFYHCHESSITDQREHGHFHFFTRADASHDWSHVIAMAVDNYGQPISLFTTNLWVTDGEWFDSKQLTQQMQLLEQSEDEALPLCWFKYMLLLFQDKIANLLQARDSELQRLCPHHRDHCLIDRSIYYLSMADINLNKQLFAAFKGEESLT